jgi:hypothetical protein
MKEGPAPVGFLFPGVQQGPVSPRRRDGTFRALSNHNVVVIVRPSVKVNVEMM